MNGHRLAKIFTSFYEYSYYTIRVSEYNNPNVYDESNGYFSLYDVSITLITPNGGESWQLGENNTISWTSQNLTSRLDGAFPR